MRRTMQQLIPPHSTTCMYPQSTGATTIADKPPLINKSKIQPFIVFVDFICFLSIKKIQQRSKGTMKAFSTKAQISQNPTALSNQFYILTAVMILFILSQIKGMTLAMNIRHSSKVLIERRSILKVLKQKQYTACRFRRPATTKIHLALCHR